MFDSNLILQVLFLVLGKHLLELNTSSHQKEDILKGDRGKGRYVCVCSLIYCSQSSEYNVKYSLFLRVKCTCRKLTLCDVSLQLH